jgi:hypothetical protein
MTTPPPTNEDALDVALAAYASHFDRAEPSAGLVGDTMAQVSVIAQAKVDGFSPALRQLLMLLAVRPDLQGHLMQAKNPVDFARKLQELAAQRSIAIKKGDAYALLQHPVAANDGELSDEQMDAIAAAGTADQISWLRDVPFLTFPS